MSGPCLTNERENVPCSFCLESNDLWARLQRNGILDLAHVFIQTVLQFNFTQCNLQEIVIKEYEFSAKNNTCSNKSLAISEVDANFKQEKMFHPSRNVYQPIQPVQTVFNPPQVVQNSHVKVFIFEKKADQVTSRLEEKDALSIRRVQVPLATFGYKDLITYLTEKCGLTMDNITLRYADDENDWVELTSEEEFSLCKQLFNNGSRLRRSDDKNILKLSAIIVKREEKKETQEQEHGCPYLRKKRGGCHWRKCPRDNHVPQQQRPPMLFRKDDRTGDAVLEMDINVDQLNNLDVGSFVKNNIANVEMPHYGVTCDGCGKRGRTFIGKRWKCQECDDFDYCDECFNSVACAEHAKTHKFAEVAPHGLRFLRNLFQQPESDSTQSEQEQPEQEQPAQEQQPEQPVEEPTPVVEAQPEQVVENVLYEAPQVVTFNQPHPLNIVAFQPPVVESVPVEYPHRASLMLLKDMGFHDEYRCIQSLNKHNGDMQKVIVELLNVSQ